MVVTCPCCYNFNRMSREEENDLSVQTNFFLKYQELYFILKPLHSSQKNTKIYMTLNVSSLR